MTLDGGAHLLLNELFGLHSAVVIYDSQPDDGHCTIYFGYWPSTTATKLDYPRTALVARPTHSG